MAIRSRYAFEVAATGRLGQSRLAWHVVLYGAIGIGTTIDRLHSAGGEPRPVVGIFGLRRSDANYFRATHSESASWGSSTLWTRSTFFLGF